VELLAPAECGFGAERLVPLEVVACAACLMASGSAETIYAFGFWAMDT